MVFDFFFIKFDLRMARTEGNIERLMKRFSISNEGEACRYLCMAKKDSCSWVK